MDQHDLEGRLAALEYVAKLATREFGLRMWASAWMGRHGETADKIIAKIDEGSIPAPTDPRARDAMKDSLRDLFTPPHFPPYAGPY